MELYIEVSNLQSYVTYCDCLCSWGEGLASSEIQVIIVGSYSDNMLCNVYSPVSSDSTILEKPKEDINFFKITKHTFSKIQCLLKFIPNFMPGIWDSRNISELKQDPPQLRLFLFQSSYLEKMVNFFIKRLLLLVEALSSQELIISLL